jgi:hypothetical protein
MFSPYHTNYAVSEWKNTQHGEISHVHSTKRYRTIIYGYLVLRTEIDQSWILQKL